MNTASVFRTTTSLAVSGFCKTTRSRSFGSTKTVESLVPELEGIGQFAESKRPRVRYYEGKESFQAFRRDLLSKRKDQKLVRGILILMKFLDSWGVSKTLHRSEHPKVLKVGVCIHGQTISCRIMMRS